MNRLQKKCFLVATGMHVLLLVILVFGSALRPKDKIEDSPILDFIPQETTDKEASGGGNPNVRTAPAELNKVIVPAPKPPAPAVQKNVVSESTSEPAVVKNTTEKSFEIQKKPARKQLPQVPTTLKDRKTTPTKEVAKNNINEASEREADEKRRQLLKEVGSAANDLRENASTRVKFSDESYGPGGGGVPYANFLQAVKTIYTQAWNVPDGVEDDQATTEASVTIARDGTVVRTAIIRKSGNAMVDHSVQMTLDRVRRVAPLPKESSGNERTVTIGFNVKAKRGIG